MRPGGTGEDTVLMMVGGERIAPGDTVLCFTDHPGGGRRVIASVRGDGRIEVDWRAVEELAGQPYTTAETSIGLAVARLLKHARDLGVGDKRCSAEGAYSR